MDIILPIDIETLPNMKDGAFDEFLQAEIESFKTPSSMTIGQMAGDLKMEVDPSDKKSKSEWQSLWERNFKDMFCEMEAEKKWRKTALDGSQGNVLMIGFALNDDEPIIVREDNEKDTLRKFNQIMKDLINQHNLYSSQIKFVGHNISAFDLKFLYQRHVINNIMPTLDFNDLPRERVFDTMTKWAGYREYIGLDALCGALGIEVTKRDLDGSKVYDYYLKGRIDEIAEYCKDDVRNARDAYKRMNFLMAA